MKLIKVNSVTLFGIVLTVAVTGCNNRPKTALTPLPGSVTGGGQVAVADAANKISPDSDKPSASDVNSKSLPDPNIRKDWPRDREIFKSDIVHFDYDSSVIKTEDKPKVAAVAEYFKAHPQDAIEIEGHCDQRGTEEYNRSLGERRALALREELVRLGLDPSKIDTVSYGEDRPADAGHDEAAYRKNRRGEFILEKHQTLVSLNGP